MGRLDKLTLPGFTPGGARILTQEGPDIPLETLMRLDLIAKFLEILCRAAAGAVVEDAATAVGVTFRPPLGEETDTRSSQDNAYRPA
jgi:hypothetical protein